MPLVPNFHSKQWNLRHFTFLHKQMSLSGAQKKGLPIQQSHVGEEMKTIEVLNRCQQSFTDRWTQGKQHH